MKESDWRAKLVSLYKQTRPEGFIWAMDAKFKAGFPDLYVIDRENGLGRHFELKVFSSVNGTSLGTLKKFFAPIQISVMKSINLAGGSAIGMAFNKATLNVYLFDPVQEIMFIMNQERFKHWWTVTCHSWLEAEMVS